jgi:hypothetical protein
MTARHLSEEPPPAQWLAAESDHRRERFQKRRLHFDSARRQHRHTLTALALHHLAIERAAPLSTVQAASIEPIRPGESAYAGPPRQQLLDDDPRWVEHWHVIRSRLERVHELLDEFEGLGATAVKTMSSHEKDREIITRGRGLSAQAVVDLLGSDIAGSAETVRRVRRRERLSGKDGTPLPEPSAQHQRRIQI